MPPQRVRRAESFARARLDDHVGGMAQFVAEAVIPAEALAPDYGLRLLLCVVVISLGRRFVVFEGRTRERREGYPPP